MQTALSYIADGISHFLRVRVEKVLNTEKDTIVLFAIANLLRFYQQIMRQVVQSGSLELCLIELEKSSEQIFLNSLATQVRFILHGSEGGGVSASGQGSAGGSLNINEIPTRDLTPPANLSRLLNLLKEILSVATMVNGRQSDIMKIIAHIIDPLLESVQESATHLPTIDMSVYLLNCLYQMQTTLTVYEYMDERIERLQGQMDAQIDTLTSEQATSLVTNLQLNPIYNILQSQQTQIEINLLKIFISKLEAFLEMPEILLLPQIQLITSSGHRNTVQKRSFQVILTIYKQIYERVHNPANGFVSPESIFARTPEEVAKLLVI